MKFVFGKNLDLFGKNGKNITILLLLMLPCLPINNTLISLLLLLPLEIEFLFRDNPRRFGGGEGWGEEARDPSPETLKVF